MSPEALEEIEAEQRKVLKRQYPNMSKEHLRELAIISARLAVKNENLAYFVPFEKFCEERAS
jgi:hypothetical protein